MSKFKGTVVGFKTCKYFQKASNIMAALEHLFPDKVQADIIEFISKEKFQEWIPNAKSMLLSSPYYQNGNSEEIQRLQNHKTSPMVWKNDSEFIGGCDDFINFSRNNFGIGFDSNSSSSSMKKAASLPKGLVPDNQHPEKDHGFQYDLVVIGGGSGGLALSKRAAQHGAKVALLDFVKPSPQGSEWGLGGTCVNVGCIPKKLFHQASLLGESIADAREYGWQGLGKVSHDDEGNVTVTGSPTHKWSTLVNAIQNHISSLNFGYRVQLREKKVKYLNCLGSFVDQHTLTATDKKGKSETITSRRFVIAVGGRPKQLDCPGSELAITSDDIFSMTRKPGKTLVVGASYVALECAGFLTSLGFDVTVMVRSVLLRGFDQDMAEQISKYMEQHGTKFIRGKIPTKLEEIPNSAEAPKKEKEVDISASSSDDMEEDIEEEAKNKIRVFWEGGSDVFDTVLCAVGRVPDTKSIGLDKAGVKVEASGKISATCEQTNVPHIYAIGDVLEGKLELTPIAIQAGNLLADRLYGGSTIQMDYRKVCTTVFTPLEYGTVGLSEEDSIKEHGNDNIEVYHSNFTPLEWTIPHDNRKANECYLKVIVNKLDNNRIIGMHYLGPNAGEVIQGYGTGMKLGMTYEDLIHTIGIHPTTSEEFVTVSKTKRSGESPLKTGC